MKLSIVVLLLLAALVFITAKKEGKKEDVKSGGRKLDGPVIGIDLGTTYSVVAIYRNNKTEVIPDEFGNRITASVVSFTENGDRLVGEAAKNNAAYNPKNTFYDVKRLIGRRYSEILEKDAKLFSYDIVEKNDRPYIKVERKKGEPAELLSPEEISAMVLQKMKSIAEKYLGHSVKYAVITVPAYFNDQQRQATADAGKVAGLEVLRIVNEPTAASMAYGLYKSKEHNILVFDLGGGTFDVSLLTIDNGVFEVVATAGDTRLGGEDFDLRVVDHFAKEFKKKHGKDIKENKHAFQKLKLACERAKRELSSQTETVMEIDSLIDGIDFSERLTRAMFEKVNMDLFKKTLEPVKQVLADSQLEKSDIDEIVLVGGSTRIPKVRELLSEYFNGKKLNQEVNPDEAVADGAAVQGAVLSGSIESSGRDVILVDVTPLSLGVETQGGVMSVIIPRNTPIPCDKAETYTTTENYQSRLSVPIYEGERKQAKYNRLLGTLELEGIPPAPRGVPKIKIQFQLDQNGILKIIATDEGTQKKKEITIKKGTFSDAEINKMKKDAEKNAEEDKQIIEKVEARHKLEVYIDQVNSQLQNKELTAKIKANDIAKLQKLLKEYSAWIRKHHEESTTKDFKKKFKELRKQVNPVFAELYGETNKFETDDDDEVEPEVNKKDEEINPEIADEDRPISQRKAKDEL